MTSSVRSICLGAWSGVGGGEDEGAAGDDVFAGEQAKVLAAGDAELVGPVVNLAEEAVGSEMLIAVRLYLLAFLKTGQL